jgi:hypothetical protein
LIPMGMNEYRRRCFSKRWTPIELSVAYREAASANLAQIVKKVVFGSWLDRGTAGEGARDYAGFACATAAGVETIISVCSFGGSDDADDGS